MHRSLGMRCNGPSCGRVHVCTIDAVIIVLSFKILHGIRCRVIATVRILRILGGFGGYRAVNVFCAANVLIGPMISPWLCCQLIFCIIYKIWIIGIPFVPQIEEFGAKMIKNFCVYASKFQMITQSLNVVTQCKCGKKIWTAWLYTAFLR